MTVVGKQVSIVLRNDLAELVRLREWLSEHSGPLEIGSKMQFYLNLVCEELITNTILHGCDPEKAHEIEVKLKADGQELELLITDDGVAFDPWSRPAPDVTADIDERPVGGLGIYFVKELMDEVMYERIGDRNRIRLKKIGQLPSEAEDSA